MENKGHVLLVPYPTQGHMNPMLQFGRRLASKGVKVTLAITKYINNTLKPTSESHIHLATFSDGFDEVGFRAAESTKAYLDTFKVAGSKTLEDIVEQHIVTPQPITSIVYDSFLAWVLDVARKYSLVGAPFFTQACAVNYIYLLIYHGKTTVPLEIPGLPPLNVGDLPSFVSIPESYPAYLELVVEQNCNLHEADLVLVNTFHELEVKVIDTMSRKCRLLTVGPTVPSYYLDRQIEYDKGYNINLFKTDNNTTKWLSTKPPRSVLYVAFGSMCILSKEQMEEIAQGLLASNCNFLWVVRASEEDKVTDDFRRKTGEKGLIVRWSHQLEVLANEAVGCFFTHCGWNSTLEALGSGVPMIGMPQWTDQPTVAKLVQDVWKVGVRVKVNDNGLVTKDEVVACIKEVMVGDRREEILENAQRLKELAKEAVSHGGSSDRNIDEFVSKIACSKE